MAGTMISGQHFTATADGKHVVLFAQSGERYPDGKCGVNGLFGAGAMYRFDPTSISDTVLSQVQSCFDEDTAAGNGERIAQLHLNSRHAVALYLERGLTFQHLTGIVEGDDTIVIPDVSILGHMVTVLITPNPVNSIATADANGIIL